MQPLFAAAISLEFWPHHRPQPWTTQHNNWLVVQCAHREKWWSSWMGRTTTHRWNGKEDSCLKPPTSHSCYFIAHWYSIWYTHNVWNPNQTTFRPQLLTMASHGWSNQLEISGDFLCVFSTGGVVQLSIPGHHQSRIRKITWYVLSMGLQRLQPQINLVWFLPLDLLSSHVRWIIPTLWGPQITIATSVKVTPISEFMIYLQL